MVWFRGGTSEGALALLLSFLPLALDPDDKHAVPSGLPPPRLVPGRDPARDLTVCMRDRKGARVSRRGWPFSGPRGPQASPPDRPGRARGRRQPHDVSEQDGERNRGAVPPGRPGPPGAGSIARSPGAAAVSSCPLVATLRHTTRTSGAWGRLVAGAPIPSNHSVLALGPAPPRSLSCPVACSPLKDSEGPAVSGLASTPPAQCPCPVEAAGVT